MRANPLCYGAPMTDRRKFLIDTDTASDDAEASRERFVGLLKARLREG